MKVNSFNIPAFVLLLVVVLITGCEQDRGVAGSTARVALSTANLDPCAIVLSSQNGNQRVDQQINRYQQHVRDAELPAVYLERLGWAFIKKARTTFDAGYYTLAEKAALCIESKQPNSVEALLLRGHALHNLHRFKDAETLARELVKQRGLWFDFGLLGDVLMEQGYLSDAAEAYQKMMDQRPGPQAYARAAHLRWLTGDLSGAIEMMRKAAWASGSRSRESGAWAYTNLALYELQDGHPSKASQHINSALSLQPDYAPALLAQGRLLLASGKYAEAIEPLSHAAELNPLPQYQWALIESLRYAGRTEQIHAIEARLIRYGETGDARTLALYLATTGQYTERALRLAERELQIRQDIVTADTLAWAMYAAGRFHEALTLSRCALAEGTLDARLFYHAAVIAAAVGQDAEAARWLAEAIKIKRMLLPSERAQLEKEFAAHMSQTSVLAQVRPTP